MIPYFLSLLVIIQLADYHTTLTLLSQGLHEQNPVMQIAVADPLVFLCIKLGGAMVMAWCALNAEKMMKKGTEVACAACCISVLPVVNNVAWICCMG